MEKDWRRERQQRLLHLMEAGDIDVTVLSNPKTIFYFTGALLDPAMPHALVADANGKTTLITSADPPRALASEIRKYTGYTLDRVFCRRTWHEEAVLLVRDSARRVRHAALEHEWAPHELSGYFASSANVTRALDQLRRQKDPDEIAGIKATIEIVEAGYAAAKAKLAPGITELDMYSAIQTAIVEAAGTRIDLPGDYACGLRCNRGGGPPTRRKVQKGDLYILDIFPNFNGYTCDLCRTFAVGEPSALQWDTWDHVNRGHEVAARMLRPGARAKDVYAALKEHLDGFGPLAGSFFHHAGHGVGMDGWEFPWLTPGSDHVIEAGEVVAFEPGLYGDSVAGGVRLEHNYLITDNGPVALDSFPMEL